MSKIFLIYSTGDGQTAKISACIARKISEINGSITVTLHNGDQPLDPEFSCENYDGIIVGSSLRSRKYGKSVIDFIRKYNIDLARRPSAFFSVSLGDSAGWSKSGMNKLLDGLFKEWRWQPRLVGRFAGALKYTHYRFWIKWSMSLAGFLMGYPTDTSRDHELTNWDDVERFAQEFIAQMSLSLNG